MSHFLPLLPTSQPDPAEVPTVERRVKLQRASHTGRDFKPVAMAFSAFVPEGADPTAPTPNGTDPHQPSVTLIRDGDHISHIRIQCPCGMLINLECVF